MFKTIATTDGLATLHFDHEDWELFADFHVDATPDTTAEVITIAGLEGCRLLTSEEMDAEHLEDNLVRYHMAYLPGKEPIE